jgi:tetrahydromethanopterin S-methyltransferase subunit G
MKREIYKRKVDTTDELFARILNAAARMKQREDKLRRTTRDLRKRIAKSIEVDVGIFVTFVVSCMTSFNTVRANH